MFQLEIIFVMCREKITNNLYEKELFYKTLLLFKKEGIFGAISSVDEFMKSFEKNKEKAVEEVLDLFNKKGRFTEEAIELIIPLEIKEKINKNTDFLKEFIKKQKKQMKGKFSKIILPKFTNHKEIAIDDILTSLEIKKIIKKDILTQGFEKSNYDYKNFYKIFQKKLERIIIQGEPGMGKTVQFRYLMYKWSKDEWCNDNENDDYLVLFIRLRKVETNDFYQSIVNENFKHDKYITKTFVKRLFKEKRNSIILFIDGADEFNHENPKLKQIIDDGLNIAQTVIWTRNWKAEKISVHATILFELLGLNPDQLTSLISKCFYDDKKTSKKFMDKITNISEMESFCRNPFLTLLIFKTWKKNDDIIQKCLYDILEMALETLKDHSVFNLKLPDSFLFECFKQLTSTKVILNKDKKIISIIDDTIGSVVQILNDSFNRKRVFIQFYHLLLQEFFAAKYILKIFENPNSYGKYFSSTKKYDLLNEHSPNLSFILRLIKDKSPQTYLEVKKHFKNIQNKTNHNHGDARIEIFSIIKIIFPVLIVLVLYYYFQGF